MSENVETVRRLLVAMSAGPEEVRACVGELWDGDADYYPVRKFPEAQPCHGREEVAEFLARFRETWSRFEWEVQEAFAIGDDRVLVCGSLRAEGHVSGMTLADDLYQCCWLRHGHIFRAEDHLTLRGALHAFGLDAETLEAAGLRERS